MQKNTSLVVDGLLVIVYSYVVQLLNKSSKNIVIKIVMRWSKQNNTFLWLE